MEPPLPLIPERAEEGPLKAQPSGKNELRAVGGPPSPAAVTAILEIHARGEKVASGFSPQRVSVRNDGASVTYLPPSPSLARIPSHGELHIPGDNSGLNSANGIILYAVQEMSF